MTMSQDVKFTLKVYETPDEKLESKIKIKGEGALIVAALACTLVAEAQKEGSYLFDVMDAAVEVAKEALSTDNPEEAIGHIVARKVQAAKSAESLIDVLRDIEKTLRG